MKSVLVAPCDCRDGNHVFTAIEKTRVDKNRARSFSPGADHQPVNLAQALAADSENRCAELDVHSGPSRIRARDASPASAAVIARLREYGTSGDSLHIGSARPGSGGEKRPGANKRFCTYSRACPLTHRHSTRTR